MSSRTQTTNGEDILAYMTSSIVVLCYGDNLRQPLATMTNTFPTEAELRSLIRIYLTSIEAVHQALPTHTSQWGFILLFLHHPFEAVSYLEQSLSQQTMSGSTEGFLKETLFQLADTYIATYQDHVAVTVYNGVLDQLAGSYLTDVAEEESHRTLCLERWKEQQVREVDRPEHIGRYDSMTTAEDRRGKNGILERRSGTGSNQITLYMRRHEGDGGKRLALESLLWEPDELNQAWDGALGQRTALTHGWKQLVEGLQLVAQVVGVKLEWRHQFLGVLAYCGGLVFCSEVCFVDLTFCSAYCLVDLTSCGAGFFGDSGWYSILAAASAINRAINLISLSALVQINPDVFVVR
ncbi:hypothetical protein K470DRAFT_265552 [Piedraia hortae CBS 480.64]|uniref:Uncharacterized protein n=1 Tax=Piedraia hortae CBS 480.64 TaxID=1314780 RepID=A0A6A7BWE7_9PEZI|nr:hypothetical protein K470DRAFT_265552 [Piedraia hortae CBS 480.64]